MDRAEIQAIKSETVLTSIKTKIPAIK